MKKSIVAAVGVTLTTLVGVTHAQTDVRTNSWLINTTGQKGHSTDATINGYVSQINSDVREVWYTGTDVYVKSSDVPSHDVGPFPGNPAYPADQNSLWRIPRSPAPGAHAATPMGPIGVMVNGAEFFNAKDAATYLNAGYWHQNAVVVEGPSFDAALGHPAPQGSGPPPLPGAYHYHEHPQGLQGQLHDDGTKFSPLLGYAFDGYPIYGGYGYNNPLDINSGIKRLNSSYQLRSITQRHSFSGGGTLPSNQWGPDVSTQYPLGYYIEDYEYLGTGDLDLYNGEFTITPDFPSGTYAYFATLTATGAGAYPYLMGPTYYGTAAADDLSHSVAIPGGATQAAVPEPASCAGLLIAAAALVSRRSRRGRGVVSS